MKAEPTEPETHGADNDVDIDSDDDKDSDNARQCRLRRCWRRLDVDAEEAGMYLQSAHRAGALDVLAGIELKLALMREASCREDGRTGVKKATILRGARAQFC